ncbi:MAG: hypothetical protein U0U67_13845 [Chitinophagales bacterium]
MEPTAGEMGLVVCMMYLIFFYLPLFFIVAIPLFLYNKIYKMNINVMQWTLGVLLSVFLIDLVLFFAFDTTMLTILTTQ